MMLLLINKKEKRKRKISDDVADLDQVLDGIFEQNVFADPTALPSCYD